MFSRPLVLGGHGIRCSGRIKWFREAVETLGWPVVTTQFAKDLLPYDHPLFVGHCGVRGDRAANVAVQNCDYLRVIGSSLHEQTVGYDRALFAPGATIGTENETILVSAPERRAWLAQCQSWKADYSVWSEPHHLGPADGPANIYEFVHTLSDLLTGNETVITDAGCAWYIMGQAFRLKAGQRYITCGSLAAMGWTMPACTGAAFGGAPRVIGVTGDGSFQTNVHELAVWRKHHLPVILFVLDNAGYSCIRRTQEQYCGGRFVGIDDASGVGMPGIHGIAAAYGIGFVEACTRENLVEAMQFALKQTGPTVVRIACHKDQRFLPTAAAGKPLDEMEPVLRPESRCEDTI